MCIIDLVPTYSYACTTCSNAFDIVQSFSDDALTICPQCNGPLRKLYKNVGVVFKGSGFYRNDSRSSHSSHSSSSSNNTSNDTTSSSSDMTSSSSSSPQTSDSNTSSSNN